MNFMRCDAMIQRLNEIVDGEASCGERFGFYVHMAMCWKCRRYLRQFKQMRSLVGQVSVEELPQDFLEVMSKALDSEAGSRAREVDGLLIGRPVWISKK